MAVVLSPAKSSQLHKKILLQAFDYEHTLWLLYYWFTVWRLLHSYHRDRHHFHKNKIALLCLFFFSKENILWRKKICLCKNCFQKLKQQCYMSWLTYHIWAMWDEMCGNKEIKCSKKSRMHEATQDQLDAWKNSIWAEIYPKVFREGLDR